jgi:hypothetical protein
MKKIVLITTCLMFLVCGNTLASIDNDAESHSEAFSGSSITDNSTTHINDRKFVNPGVIPMAGTNGFFTTPTPDSSFRSIRDIFKAFMGSNKYCMIVTKGTLKNMAKGGDVELHLQILRGEDQVPRIYGDDFEGTEYFYIAIEEPVIKDGGLLGTKRIDGLTVTGLIDGEADDAETNSLQVIGKAGLKALADGNNYMVITAEGHHRMVEASGWGIGFYIAGGTVTESGKESATSGGGTGYSKNRTTPEDKPWIQGYVGVRDMPIPPIK